MSLGESVGLAMGERNAFYGRGAAPFRFPWWIVLVVLVISLWPLMYHLNTDFSLATGEEPFSTEKLVLWQLSHVHLSDEVFYAMAGGIQHALLEWSAVVLAIFCVLMSFIHYSVSKDAVAPMIGLALLMSGSMDLFHTLAATRLIDTVSVTSNVVPFSWMASRSVHAGVLLLGVWLILLGRRSVFMRWSHILLLGFILLGLLYLLTLWMASSPNIPNTQFPEQWLSRPYDVIPMVVLAVCIPFYGMLYRRNPSFLTATLFLALVSALCSQAYMALGSRAFFDHYFNSAHGLKILSYALPFVGYLLDYRQMFLQRQDVFNQALLKAEQRYQSINFLMPVGVLLVNKKGDIVEANQQALDMFGYSLEEMSNLNVDALVPEAIRNAHAGLRAGFSKENRMRKMAADNANLKGQRKDGDIFSVEIGLAPIQLDDERYVVASIMDVSERKHMVEELRVLAQKGNALNQALMKAEQRYRSINFLMPVGILLVNNGGTIMEANQQAQDMFGYTLKEMDGLNVDELVPESIRGSHARLREGFSKENRMRKMAADNADLMGKRKSGEIFPVEIGLAPITLDDDRYVVASIMDVSERKHMVEELKEKNEQMDRAIDKLTRSNEQLERFAFVCSHDLQEPVRMVLSFSQLLDKRVNDQLDEKSKEYLNFITDGALRAREMISDILTFCRLDQSTDSRALVKLEEVCQQVKNTLQGVIDDKGAVVEWEADLPALYAVPSQVFQLLLNLVNNGLKFNRSEAPAVHIRHYDDGDYWRLEVQDNGIGIDPKYQSKLFQIFQRLNTKAEFPGTGIGLAICKKIADQHGARIVIDSAPDQGATFLVKWPKNPVFNEE